MKTLKVSQNVLRALCEVKENSLRSDQKDRILPKFYFSTKKNYTNFFSRFLTGMADAACFCSVTSMMMKFFPNNVTKIVSWTEMLFGLGYMLG